LFKTNKVRFRLKKYKQIFNKLSAFENLKFFELTSFPNNSEVLISPQIFRITPGYFDHGYRRS
jgi:hypothetical protein